MKELEKRYKNKTETMHTYDSKEANEKNMTRNRIRRSYSKTQRSKDGVSEKKDTIVNKHKVSKCYGQNQLCRINKNRIGASNMDSLSEPLHNLNNVLLNELDRFFYEDLINNFIIDEKNKLEEMCVYFYDARTNCSIIPHYNYLVQNLLENNDHKVFTKDSLEAIGLYLGGANKWHTIKTSDVRLVFEWNRGAPRSKEISVLLTDENLFKNAFLKHLKNVSKIIDAHKLEAGSSLCRLKGIIELHLDQLINLLQGKFFFDDFNINCPVDYSKLNQSKQDILSKSPEIAQQITTIPYSPSKHTKYLSYTTKTLETNGVTSISPFNATETLVEEQLLTTNHNDLGKNNYITTTISPFNATETPVEEQLLTTNHNDLGKNNYITTTISPFNATETLVEEQLLTTNHNDLGKNKYITTTISPFNATETPVEEQLLTTNHNDFEGGSSFNTGNFLLYSLISGIFSGLLVLIVFGFCYFYKYKKNRSKRKNDLERTRLQQELNPLNY
ncbi:hypothetical protein NGRA_3085 [Nosema granulosis]|uniref:Uncharacterized protein n=1 Tax=Nosema granulosis TaxID=83296 RepID=A0A9P6KXU4_9MICR|nr:hypothetical protein NGRA_3085 [Nosema granulosis]